MRVLLTSPTSDHGIQDSFDLAFELGSTRIDIAWEDHAEIDEAVDTHPRQDEVCGQIGAQISR